MSGKKYSIPFFGGPNKDTSFETDYLPPLFTQRIYTNGSYEDFQYQLISDERGHRYQLVGSAAQVQN